jgi:hypothetical protein
MLEGETQAIQYLFVQHSYLYIASTLLETSVSLACQPDSGPWKKAAGVREADYVAIDFQW